MGQPYKTMESTHFCVNIGNRIVNLIAIYRPLDSNILEFYNEFTNLLENHINSCGELLLLGDCNIAINKPFDSESATFLDILDSFSMVNRVVKPSYRLANTLNFITHDADSNIIPKIKVDRLFSDHNIVLFDIAIPSTTTTSKVQAYSKYKDINPNAFMKDVWKSLLDKPPGPSHDSKINYYSTTLQQYWTTMHLSKVKNSQVTPRSPGLTVTLLKPSDTEDNLRGTGTRTIPM